MPGLAGIVPLNGALDREAASAQLDAMTRAMSHRAPGGWTRAVHSHLASACACGRGDEASGEPDHSIRAPSAGSRFPLAVAFTGVLTNRERMRARLEREGVSPSCDDRTLLARAWKQWGAKAIDALDGRYAFALHDGGARRSYLVRDRFGHLPMHYMVSGDRVYFASEIKPLLAVAGSAPALDELALLEWSLHGDLLAPRTLFRGVHTLAPGHLLEIGHDRRETVVRTYYDPADIVNPERYREHSNRPIPEALDVLESAVERAVVAHMDGRSDVSVMLSGGVDSTVIAALAARHTHLTAYNFSIANNARLDERPMASVVASRLGIPLEGVPVNGDIYRRELAATTWSFEMPLWHMQGVPIRMLARRAADDGAGMLLSGVSVGPWLGAAADRMRWISTPRAVERIPSGAFRVMRKAVYAASGLPVVNPFFTLTLGTGVHLVDGGARAALVRRHEEAYGFLPEAERLPHVMRMTDNVLFLRRFFHQGDRLCMSSSVEYCDASVEADFQTLAFNTPASRMYRKGKWKWILKELATRYVPREISFQKKIPLDVPVDEYFAPQFRASTFENGFLERYLGMPWKAVERVASVGRDRAAAMFRLVNLETWGRLFLLDQSVEEVAMRLTRFTATVLCAALAAAHMANELVGMVADQLAATAM